MEIYENLFKLHGMYAVFTIILNLLFFMFLIKIFTSKKNKNKKSKLSINIDKSYNYNGIPCNGNIEIAYWLLYYFESQNQNNINKGLISAYLLYWYQKRHIDIIFSKNDKDYGIDLKDGNWEKSNSEQYMYDFLKNVAGNNNILEKNEIINYCSIGANDAELKILGMKIFGEVKKELESQNLIILSEQRRYNFNEILSQIELTDNLKDELQNLIGLKNYLLDNSNMEEKKKINIDTWKEYLIFANLFGIENDVKNQLKTIHQDSESISELYEISFSNIVAKKYKNKSQKSFTGFSLVLLGCLIPIGVLILLGKPESSKSFVNILILVFSILMSILFLRKYLLNRKVKEMNKTTRAKITNVSVESRTYHDEDGISRNEYTYFISYEYMLNGVCYKGTGVSRSIKFKGQKIKIYYNEMRPEKSEIAEKHNQYLRLVIFIYVIILLLYLVFDKRILNIFLNSGMLKK